MRSANRLPRIAPVLLALHVTAATAAEPLPEPLRLQDALSTSLDNHPTLMQQQAQQALAEARRRQATAQDDFRLDLNLEARWIEPSENALHDEHDDSRASLALNKTLYDFGRTRHAARAAETSIMAEEKQYRLEQLRHRRRVMARFFDVLLADLEYARENEAMATAFVRFDRAKDRNELGEVSDIDLLALEATYQQQRLKRQRAEDRQRHSREQLALALNRPGELSSELLPPELPGNRNPLPDFDQLLAEAEKNNLQIAALQDRLAAVQSQRDAARAQRNPRLFFNMEATQYQRETASRDPFVASLGLRIPLYQGDRTGASTAAAEAEIQTMKAELRAQKFQLRQELLDIWQRIQTLLSQQEQARVLRDYRDLYLDRSRARYELEIKTDLGDAMVEQSAARLFAAKTDYDLALAREKLVELTGNPAYSALAPAKPVPTDEENTP